MMNVPLVGDERQLAEVDLLLDHVLVALDPVHFLARDQAQRALSGAENVRSRSWHSSIEYFGSPML